MRRTEHCRGHLALVTTGGVWARLRSGGRRRYYVRCWSCHDRWGPMSRDQAHNAQAFAGEVAFEVGRR